MEAYRLMRERFSDIRTALAELVGPEIHIAMARRGDVVLRIIDSQEAIGLCAGQETAFLSDTELPAYWPTLEQVCAFRVQ